MKINIIKEITIKELKAQFDHISGYILIAIFLGLAYFFFLKTFYLNGVVSMKSLFEMLPMYLAIFIPAVTMGSFASEFERQTLEYLETKPLKQIDLIIGKILGATKITFIAILLTLPLPFFISRIAPLDIGETFANYLGALILVLALSSLGVAVSTFYKNQIAAFITCAVLIFALIIINSDITAINMPVALSNSLAQFSIVDNYNPIVRGVVSLNNIIYFVIFVVTAVAIAYANLQKIRISRTTDLYKKTFSIILIVAVAGITLSYLSNYFGQQVGRIDLTTNNRYTLAKATKDLLHEDGKIIIEVFASKNLPAAYSNAYEEIKNLLADYKSAGGSNLEIKYINPDTNGERISTLGIAPVQFNTVGEDQLQIQQGYLALAIMNEDESKKEKIDYIQGLDDLEYQITSLISKIKSDKKPVIGFASGNGEKGPFTEYTFLDQALQNEYDMRTIYFAGEDNTSADTTTDAENSDLNLKDYNLIVISGPTEDYTEDSLRQINEYINNGGNVIYLGDTLAIDMATGAVSPISGENIGQILKSYGATINPDMVYDTRSNVKIPYSDTLSTPYPYFMLNNRDGNAQNVVQFLPENILSPWAASLNLDTNWQWLYATSEAGGKSTGQINIDPMAQIEQQNTGRIPLVAIRKTDSGGTLVIGGSSRIFEDSFASLVQENVVLALALFENMAKGRGLSEIKSKNLLGSQFTYLESDVKQTINYGAPITSAVLLVLIGASRIYRKKKLAKVYA